MISFSFSDLVSVVSVVGAFAALLFTVMMLYTQRRHTKYDDERHRIELELMRRSIESQMYGLNEKLLATEDRWRDVNHLLISSQSRQPDVVETAKQGLPSTFFSRIYAGTHKLPDGREFFIDSFYLNLQDNFIYITAYTDDSCEQDLSIGINGCPVKDILIYSYQLPSYFIDPGTGLYTYVMKNYSYYTDGNCGFYLKIE